jgi:AcrR family transcriptional regulator
MSPQHSNRERILEGTLRCLERLPPEQITARAIARESGANLASITYHFGSKNNLVTEAVTVGLDRWLDEIATALVSATDGAASDSASRLLDAARAVDVTRRWHSGLARTFTTALAMAQHDARVRDLLAEGFRRSRTAVASLFGLGDDLAGRDAAGLLLAIFDGLLFQGLLDDDLVIEGDRTAVALARLRTVLPADE